MAIPQNKFKVMGNLFNQKHIDIAFFILLILAISFVMISSAKLPSQMATHFNAAGTVDGFMSKESYTCAMLSVVAGVPCLLSLTPLALSKLPTSWVNIPHRAYWLAPKIRAATLKTFNFFMSEFACVHLIFLSYLHWLVIQANEQQPPAMSAPDVYLGLFFFLLLIGIWSVLLLRRFKLPPAEES
jgi:uncharacterized membrane protein